MSANSNQTTEVTGKQLEIWVPKVINSLRTNWADYFLNSTTEQLTPSFSDWLMLVHAAAATPDQLPRYLTQLLSSANDQSPPHNEWVMLTDMLDITFNAARANKDDLSGADWEGLLEIQNRILKTAARISAHPKAHPDTGTLSRRALYLQIVAELDKSIATKPDADELLAYAVGLIQQDLAYDYVNIFMLNPDRQDLTLQYATWKSTQPSAENFLSLDLEQGAVGVVAATGTPMLIKDASHSPHFVPHPALKTVQSQLAVPLKTGDNILGVLDVESDQVNAFTGEDQRILSVLANYLATALENLRLHSAHTRFIKEQNLIYDTILTLGTSSNVDKVLKKMSQKITLAMEAGACVICQFNEKAGTITAVAEYVLRHPENPERTWRTLRVPTPISKDPIARQTLRVARPAISRAKSGENKQTTKNLIWRVPVGALKDTKSKWNVVLAVPIEIQSKITGIIEIYDRHPSRTFSLEDIQFCRILATQTAMAIEQARLFDETISRLNEVSMLYTMAQRIASSLDLDEVLNTIVTSLREAIGCRACCIFLIDETEEQLEIKAADGLKPQWRQMAKLQLGEGAAGIAAAESRTVYIPDTSQDPNFVQFDEEVKALMVVPLLAHGKVIGAINVDDKVTNAFGSAQERLLTIAATQAGISIENARLFTEISNEQKQMQAVIQYMADGLLMIDHRGVIITCNSTLAGMIDMHRGQIIGQNVNSPNLPANLAKVSASSSLHKLRTGVLTQEVTTETAAPRTLQVFATTLYSGDKYPTGEVRVVHDITKEKELEQLKDDFFSTISHELRTPLFSIQGFAQLLQEDPPVDRDTQLEFLQTIQRQATQLGEMVNNLLDISKLEEGKLVLERKPVLLIDVIHQTVLKLQGYAHQQQISIIPDLSAPLPMIIGDAYRLEQVLTNLIGNAIKFSPHGATIAVSAVNRGNRVITAVTDHGIGIPAENLENIFSRYYQVTQKSERSAMGTGLGLHIAKQIIDAHGGRIWVESEAGQGSTFYFSLPATD
jgi:NtrC-family two-component system sensor histidine kinase KinB